MPPAKQIEQKTGKHMKHLLVYAPGCKSIQQACMCALIAPAPVTCGSQYPTAQPSHAIHYMPYAPGCEAMQQSRMCCGDGGYQRGVGPGSCCRPRVSQLWFLCKSAQHFVPGFLFDNWLYSWHVFELESSIMCCKDGDYQRDFGPWICSGPRVSLNWGLNSKFDLNLIV